MLPDGGTLFVDAGEGGPQDSGGGGDDGGGMDAASDGGRDAGMDAAIDAGPDGGPATGLACPNTLSGGMCQGGMPNPPCISVEGEQTACCYPLAGGVPACKSASACSTGYDECCSNSDDCIAALGSGHFCCATTATATEGTRVACGTFDDCNAVGGTFLCSQPTGGQNGCPAGKVCPMLPATPYYGAPPAPTVWRCQ